MKYGIIIETAEMEDFLCPTLGGYYSLRPSELGSKPFEIKDVYVEYVVKAMQQHGVKGYSICNGDLLLTEEAMKMLVSEFLCGLHVAHLEFTGGGILATIAEEYVNTERQTIYGGFQKSATEETPLFSSLSPVLTQQRALEKAHEMDCVSGSEAGIETADIKVLSREETLVTFRTDWHEMSEEDKQRLSDFNTRHNM